jgi:hypothetical protein
VSTDRHSLSFDCSGIHSVQKEEQQQFWIQISDMNGADAANHFDVLIQTQEATTEYYKEGGEYLPLSVWATRGFDANLIKHGSRESDIMEDPVLGTVYRVRILQKGNAGSRTTLTTRHLKRKQPLPNSGAGSSGDGGATVGGDGPLAIEPEPPMAALLDVQASDNSSTSTSDSSSTSDKKKKKNKKGKKGKKDKKSKKSKKDKKDTKAQKDVCHSCPYCSSCTYCPSCPPCPSVPSAILVHSLVFCSLP